MDICPSNLTCVGQYNKLGFGFIFASFPGIISNILVLVISFYPRNAITGDYKYFLANLNLCDLFYGLAQLFQGFHMVHWVKPVSNTILCKLTGGLELWGETMLILTLPFVSLNRYIKICHSNILL